jgi:hypothetical protein
MSGMNSNRKQYEPLDDAVMDVIDELRGAHSGRTLEVMWGFSHNRTATILRRGTPPPTVGEVDAMVGAFGKIASDVIEEAERRLGGGTVVQLHPNEPLSDPDANVEPIAALKREIAEEHEEQ